MSTRNDALRAWVAQTAVRTQPDRIHWCDGSDEENQMRIRGMLANGTLL